MAERLAAGESFTVFQEQVEDELAAIETTLSRREGGSARGLPPDAGAPLS